ncbi:MAG: DEAD/DEAH box helicase family protein [Kiritimatiellae bacterium]|nr:DEAD/DEAH box helicase family protein [Kiritimatiellia bacterium]
MTTPEIKSTRPVVPMIYAYTTPGVAYHIGWTKIGYTEQGVEARIKQQTHTAGIAWKLEWKGNAMFDDGSGVTFLDSDFHAYLRAQGVEQEPGKRNEWFHITGPDSHVKFTVFRTNRGILSSGTAVIPYELRDEQKQAVAAAKTWFEGGCVSSRAASARAAASHPEFLWNCKPRFGKTLAVYDLAKRLDAKTVLIVTNRPAIANSWLQDYRRFLGRESGYRFVSETDALAGGADVLTRAQFLSLPADEAMRCIEFVSLQDLKGSVYFGGRYDKLKEVAELDWDLLVVDEAHEGVDTYKTDVAFEHIRRKATLHLSGTPFKALASGKFPDGAIFNWTYADEQRRKDEWDESREQENPYAVLPRLSLFTYRMSDIVLDKLKRGIEIDGKDESYAFDLNEFFATDGNGRFLHDAEVGKFLDALTLQKRFPFSTPELREELKHTFWLLNRVDSAKALVRKLQEHPVFKDYAVVLAAGDGRMGEGDDQEQNKRSYDKVVKAIRENDKTITVSVGQLTTGVTIPEWTGVLMLCSMKSPSLYMQAAFRAQNPCLFRDGVGYKRKTDAYVFDFDPARTLIIYEQFANDLCSDTVAGRGGSDARKRNIGELLNFFPVIGEDEDGELVELDAEKVLSIPRRIKSVEVVRRGFMSNFLFQNISLVFGAPKEVMSIIEKFASADKSESLSNEVRNASESLSLDENGEIAIADEAVAGKVSELFGNKIYGEAPVEEIVGEICEEDFGNDGTKRLKQAVREEMIRPIVEEAQESYGNAAMRLSDARKLVSQLTADAERQIDKVTAECKIEQAVIEQERTKALQSRYETGRSEAAINREFDKRQKEAAVKNEGRISEIIKEIAEGAKREAVRTIETKTREHVRDEIEDKVRDHLRGFARTIPSFLMAYGDERTSLETFDTIIPDGVFREVTGITLAEFRFLRDGGTYTDGETGEEKTFTGQLFDPVVFNDSVKEFLAKRYALANYFDESAEEDIFDYIPPQKTNQIFTPRKVVAHMVDLLETENPGCFDDSSKTFIDLYMKSGMYITEIVKRLFRSKKMKRKFPDEGERLRHIFAHQVYGLAPTEIIYRIATNYILGFNRDGGITQHNFRQIDALALAKTGTLQEKLDEVFGGGTAK